MGCGLTNTVDVTENTTNIPTYISLVTFKLSYIFDTRLRRKITESKKYKRKKRKRQTGMGNL